MTYDDVTLGAAIPSIVKGPITTAHAVRWSAAIENWHKIHYDLPFSLEHEKLPGLLVPGSLKQQFLLLLLKDWVGDAGWVWKLKYQFRAMNVLGETLTMWGRVSGKRAAPAYGLVELEIGIRNAAGVESAPGNATVALPYRGGPALPYPFTPPDRMSES